ncbi:hypothetical protein QYE76_031588 [Lolium multiflorum]|uniref:Transposon protein, putative, CACTA, En/Spm sub-class n=1 Tax=Lolium multiflorum TaxID=4521 RepID=A0AAD8QT52_LOLMU|nr:hypothetical protein QYE76_031588 [Lolium multiflorum]
MEEDEEGDDIDESYLDHFGDTFMDDAEGGEGEGEGDQEEARDEPADDLGRTIADARSRCETEKERENLDRMLEDHKKSLYPGCDNGLKKLGCTLDLLRWKAQEGVADSGFENLLKMLKNMFPKNNELPSSTYEAKKVVCPLGLEVLKIHACINDCILYRGEYENLNECPVCTALRYKIRGDDPGDDVEGQKPRKKVPAKVMWYAPIIPRLKRLFRNKEHAKLLRWHKEDRKSDGELRHPADGTQWRKIDREFKDFAADARNIRFGLSTDGMNPFGEQSSSHSTWPVTLCIYNLPPWLCMKRKFIMMPVLIQGCGVAFGHLRFKTDKCIPAYRRRYTMAKESPKWTNNTKPRHIRQGADVDKDQERRNSHGARKKEKEELDAPGRNFRPCWPELPPPRTGTSAPKDRNFRPDAAKMPSSAQRNGSGRNFRPEGPELPPTRNFRPSSAQVPKVRQNAPGCYCKETG